MFIPYGNIHYRCSIDLQTQEPDDDSWSILIKTIRKWVSKKPAPGKDDSFWKRWFFLGGKWKSTDKRGIYVDTARFIGDRTSDTPQYWALRYQHPCDENPEARIWITDIGVTILGEKKFRLNLRLSHRIKEGYIGEEPGAPSHTAPAVIKKLINNNYWSVSSGGVELRSTPRVLSLGSVVRRYEAIGLDSGYVPQRGKTLCSLHSASRYHANVSAFQRHFQPDGVHGTSLCRSYVEPFDSSLEESPDTYRSSRIGQ